MVVITQSTFAEGNISFQTGNDFLQLSENQNPEVCNAFIAGVSEGINLSRSTSEKMGICVSAEGITVRQEKDVLIKYLRDMPERRSVRTGPLLIEVLRKSFPCVIK